MADFVVTSTADSGSGSLREALAQIRNGETITFDDSLEDANGVITITLAADSSALSIPAYQFTIDGGSHTGSGATLQTRVIIDAAASSTDLRRVATCATGCGATFKDVTFKNGYLSASSFGGGFYLTYTNDVVFNNCVFDTCHANDGGGVIFRFTSKGTFNNCLFKNCNAANYGGGVDAINSDVSSFNNCIFVNCSSSRFGGGAYFNGAGTSLFNSCFFSDCSAANGGAAYVTSAFATAFNDCTFSNCTSTGAGTTLYLTSTAQVDLTNGVIITPDANTKATILNESTNTSGGLLINSVIYCDIITFSTNSTTVINGKLTADVLTISNDATVTFSGIDAVLAVTTAATIGAATFTAAADSTGYAAFPAGTDISAATFTGVKVATYGSVTSINATIDANVATFTIQAASTGYLIEGSTDGVTWETITPTDGKATLTSAKAYQFRAFAGAFVYSPVIPRTYYYTGGTADGDFSVAADWALDKDKSIVCSDAPTIKDGVFYCVEVE